MKWLGSSYRYSSKESKKMSNPGLSLKKCQLLGLLLGDGAEQVLCLLPHHCFLLSRVLIFPVSSNLCYPGGVVLHHSPSLLALWSFQVYLLNKPRLRLDIGLPKWTVS